MKPHALQPAMHQPEPVLDIFLQPGEFYFGDGQTRIRTTLGSCVSITMWHPQRRIGGMCHYMLPSRDKKPQKELDGRYGDEAMQIFLREIRRAKTRPQDYQIKLFGGGHMFAQDRPASAESCNVSRMNREVAHLLMTRHGFHITAEHTGGNGHRNLIFDVGSGDVWMRQIPVLDLVK